MREILFRGKRIDNGEWEFGWYEMTPYSRWPLKPTIIPAQKAHEGHYEHVEVDPATVGQFTGLLDKNGYKIFEGDIVQYYGTYALEVFIEKGHTKFRWFDAVTNTKYAQLFFDSDEELGECEVIGNIHDDPELLEG